MSSCVVSRRKISSIISSKKENFVVTFCHEKFDRYHFLLKIFKIRKRPTIKIFMLFLYRGSNLTIFSKICESQRHELERHTIISEDVKSS